MLTKNPELHLSKYIHDWKVCCHDQPLLVLRSDLSSLAVQRFPNCSDADTSFLSQFTLSLNSFCLSAGDYFLLPLCMTTFTNANLSIAGTNKIPKYCKKKQKKKKNQGFQSFNMSKFLICLIVSTKCLKRCKYLQCCKYFYHEYL